MDLRQSGKADTHVQAGKITTLRLLGPLHRWPKMLTLGPACPRASCKCALACTMTQCQWLTNSLYLGAAYLQEKPGKWMNDAVEVLKLHRALEDEPP